MDKIFKLLERELEQNTLIQLSFGGQRRKSLPYRKVSVRPLMIKDRLLYQAQYFLEKKAVHENLDRAGLLSRCTDLMERSFKQLNIFTEDADYQILAADPQNPHIIKRPPTKKPMALVHNIAKQYIIPEGIPCDFLELLGVMNRDGKVLHKHYGKFRQINRFLEIVDDISDRLPREGKLKIIDFGCGKAYLTFALYHYLHLSLGREVEIIGLDLKEDVVSFCNQAARQLGYDGLHFLTGDIADYDTQRRADMVVTLHACDTATDYALMKAVSWNAKVILCVPCCQHELFGQLKNDLHQPIFKYGILKERFAAILTDGLRAMSLEEAGYQVDLIEFTSLEHTSKNIMIRGVRSGISSEAKQASLESYHALTEFWHVSPCISQLEKENDIGKETAEDPSSPSILKAAR